MDCWSYQQKTRKLSEFFKLCSIFTKQEQDTRNRKTLQINAEFFEERFLLLLNIEIKVRCDFPSSLATRNKLIWLLPIFYLAQLHLNRWHLNDFLAYGQTSSIRYW